MRQDLPPVVQAWTISEARLYMEGKGSRPDVNCEELRAMRDRLLKP
jgi:hypothetical protein